MGAHTDTVNKKMDKQDEIYELFRQIEEKSSDGECIYRGESELYASVSSTLYREHGATMEVAHKEMLDQAKYYTNLGDEKQFLTEAQHLGGSTKLIDFSYDYNVALFFACRQAPNKNGRIIIVNKQGIERVNKNKAEEDKIKIIVPRPTYPRITAQKSVLIHHPQGYLQAESEYQFVEVTANLKNFILENIKKHHGISWETLFNDVYGFIEYQRIRKKANRHFSAGLDTVERGESDKAIKHFTISIEHDPQSARAYNNRGVAYNRKGMYKESDQRF